LFFVVYTYRTDDGFRQAVASVLTVFQQKGVYAASKSNAADSSVSHKENLDSSSSDEDLLGKPSTRMGKSLLYIPSTALHNPDSVISMAKESGYDGIVVDLKVQGGAIEYLSNIDTEAVRRAQSAEAYDLHNVALRCAEQGMRLVGRLSAFADHQAPASIQGSGVLVSSGVFFLDGNYQRSLDPYRAPALEYVAALLREVIQQGVNEVIVADVRFPYYGRVNLVLYDEVRPKPEQLMRCIAYLCETAAGESADVVLSVELPMRAFYDADYASSAGQLFASQLVAPLIVSLSSADLLRFSTDLHLLSTLLENLPSDFPLTLSIPQETVSAQALQDAVNAQRLIIGQ